MPRPRLKPRIVPTDQEILAYDNVPAQVAADYIGWSTATLYYALQDGRAPFGFVSVNKDASTYSGYSYAYNISPGLLVAYKRGTLACPRLADVMRVLLDAVEELVGNGCMIRVPSSPPDDED